MKRILYGPYRLKGPLIRKGWKQWADDGFPELDAAMSLLFPSEKIKRNGKKEKMRAHTSPKRRRKVGRA